MDALKELWAKKYEQQGRINITVFFVNLFLLLCHVLFMAVYVIVDHKFMMCVNVVSLLVYILSIPWCYKKISLYMRITFVEMCVHMVCGILSFGWTPCYQNWCFGIIVAYFLPAFNLGRKTKERPFIYALIVMITYFFMATFYPLLHLKISMELNIYMNSILFIANNLFTFVAITLFATFYTLTRERKEMELSRKADYDELTDLYNRYAIAQLSEKVIKAAKERGESYYVAILDIDFFKKINDEYGHTAGDIVLKKVASMIRAFAVGNIIVGRWGGEEFVLLTSHHMGYEEFTATLEDLRKKISEVIFNVGDKIIKLTVSIGAKEITTYKSIDDAVKLADINLYEAKQTGRNKLVK